MPSLAPDGTCILPLGIVRVVQIVIILCSVSLILMIKVRFIVPNGTPASLVVTEQTAVRPVTQSTEVAPCRRVCTPFPMLTLCFLYLSLSHSANKLVTTGLQPNYCCVPRANKNPVDLVGFGIKTF